MIGSFLGLVAIGEYVIALEFPCWARGMRHFGDAGGRGEGASIIGSPLVSGTTAFIIYHRILRWFHQRCGAFVAPLVALGVAFLPHFWRGHYILQKSLRALGCSTSASSHSP